MNYKGSCHCGKVAFEVEGEGGIGKQSREQAAERPLRKSHHETIR